MGLFSRKRKPDPVIDVQGLRILYQAAHEFWLFTYEGIDFLHSGTNFVLPTLDRLNSILRDVETLKPEMLQRLAKGWEPYDEVKMADGESFCVHLDDLESQGTFEVQWSGGAAWGDMGITFTIKDQVIIAEDWGD